MITKQGYNIADFEKVTVVIELLDAEKNVIENKSGSSIKLTAKPNDWTGFVHADGVKSGQKSELKLENYPNGESELYLVVQNANTEVNYIRVTSITLEASQTAEPTSTPAAEPTKAPVAEPTGTPVAKVEPAINTSEFINANAYTGTWNGSFYNIGKLVTDKGYKVSDFTDVILTFQLYDADKKLIENTGGATAKLVKTNNDWSEPIVQVHGVQSCLLYTSPSPRDTR